MNSLLVEGFPYEHFKEAVIYNTKFSLETNMILIPIARMYCITCFLTQKPKTRIVTVLALTFCGL